MFKYTTKGGETLRSIADTLTLSPEYAIAIANYNGLDAFQAETSFTFPPNEVIGIPDEWLKPAIATTIQTVKGPLQISVTGAGGYLQRSQIFPGIENKWLFIGAAVVLVMLAVTSSNTKND